MTKKATLYGATLLAVAAVAATITVQIAPASPAAPSAPERNESLLDGLVTAGTYALVTPADIVAGTEDAGTFRVAAVDWQTVFGGEEWRPVDQGDTVVAVTGNPGVWTQAAGVASAGGNLLLGLTSGGEPGTYSVTFAIDLKPGDPAFLGDAGAVHSPELHAFLQWEGNAFGACSGLPTDCVKDFLIAWNAEAHANPPSVDSPAGPISLSFARYWEQIVNGTVSWQQLSPDRRSIQDAPEPIRRALSYADVWVYVPDEWKQFADGAVCLRISQGSDGCMHVTSAGAGHLVNLDGWAVVDEAITIEVRPIDDGSAEPMARWDGQVRIGEIPYTDVLRTGIVLVTLDPSKAPTSYLTATAAAQAGPLATAKAITQAELFQLLDQEPAASPDACGLTCS